MLQFCPFLFIHHFVIVRVIERLIKPQFRSTALALLTLSSAPLGTADVNTFGCRAVSTRAVDAAALDRGIHIPTLIKIRIEKSEVLDQIASASKREEEK